jgi:membrane-bound inhibitor of C-type lysozyme
MSDTDATRNAKSGHWQRIGAATLAATLAGCSLWGGDKGPTVRTVEYQCPGGDKFAVTFTGENSARLMIPGEEERPLKRTPAASGARYGDGTLSLLTKGNDALLEERGKIRWRDCRAR